jgi:hypothetical protein
MLNDEDGFRVVAQRPEFSDIRLAYHVAIRKQGPASEIAQKGRQKAGIYKGVAAVRMRFRVTRERIECEGGESNWRTRFLKHALAERMVGDCFPGIVTHKDSDHRGNSVVKASESGTQPPF